MLNNLDEKTLQAVSKYLVAFIIIALAGACVYLYIDCQKVIERKDLVIEQLNDKIREKDEKALDYEKERAARYEFLLNNLPKASYQRDVKKSN